MQDLSEQLRQLKTEKAGSKFGVFNRSLSNSLLPNRSQSLLTLHNPKGNTWRTCSAH